MELHENMVVSAVTALQMLTSKYATIVFVLMVAIGFITLAIVGAILFYRSRRQKRQQKQTAGNQSASSVIHLNSDVNDDVIQPSVESKSNETSTNNGVKDGYRPPRPERKYFPTRNVAKDGFTQLAPDKDKIHTRNDVNDVRREPVSNRKNIRTHNDVKDTQIVSKDNKDRAKTDKPDGNAQLMPDRKLIHETKYVQTEFVINEEQAETDRKMLQTKNDVKDGFIHPVSDSNNERTRSNERDGYLQSQPSTSGIQTNPTFQYDYARKFPDFKKGKSSNDVKDGYIHPISDNSDVTDGYLEPVCGSKAIQTDNSVQYDYIDPEHRFDIPVNDVTMTTNNNDQDGVYESVDVPISEINYKEYEI